MATSSGNNPDKTPINSTELLNKGARKITTKVDFDACFIMAKNAKDGKIQNTGYAYVLPKNLANFKKKYPDCTTVRNPIKDAD